VKRCVQAFHSSCESIPAGSISLLNDMLSHDSPAPGLSKSLGKTGFFGRSGLLPLKQPLRARLRAHFDSVNLGQTVFEFSFSKSSGTYRQSREVPLPEPELITNVCPAPWFAPKFVLLSGAFDVVRDDSGGHGCKFLSIGVLRGKERSGPIRFMRWIASGIFADVRLYG